MDEHRDDVCSPLLVQAQDDPETLGIVLHGSRGAGLGDAGSDFDLLWVLTDEAVTHRQKRGEPDHHTTYRDGRKLVEIDYTSPSRLQKERLPDWVVRGLAAATVLLDKTGEVTALLAALVTVPVEEARAETAEVFDGYLNCFYRSVKAARRGDELGARLQAAESMIYLVRTLFALDGRLPPFHDRLIGDLDTLDGQGWSPGELQTAILGILRTGDVRLQAALEDRVERLLRARGYGHVVEAWDGEIERVKRVAATSSDG